MIRRTRIGRSWTIRSHLGHHCFVLWWDLLPEEEPKLVSTMTATAALESARRGFENSLVFELMHRELRNHRPGHLGFSPRKDDVFFDLLDAVRSGEIVAYDDPPAPPPQRYVELTPPVPETPGPDIKTWIGVKLTDSRGKAISGRPYRLVKPDGGMVGGSLDSAGSTVVTGLESGQCRVTFEDRRPAGVPGGLAGAARAVVQLAVAAAPPAASASPAPVVGLLEFNNKAPAKQVDAIRSNMMGVHPTGNFPFVNAVEIIFQVNTKLARAQGLVRFQCKQTVCSQELWERVLKNGAITPWTLIVSSGEEPDDPAAGLQKIAPSVVAYHDAPGFMTGVDSETLKGPKGKTTSPRAVAVFLRQNFAGWIEGVSRSGPWKKVSDELKWHSNQHAVLDVLNTHRWLALMEGSEIELGHSNGAPSGI